MLAVGVLMEYDQQARRDLLVVPQSVGMAISNSSKIDYLNREKTATSISRVSAKYET